MKMSRQFPLNALRVFEATARQASFTKAGQELGMTQTAVSYQIKLLEESIGEPLFLRQTRRISLTEAGQRLAPKVSEAFDLLQEAVAHARNSTEGTLNIHSTATFASRWMARHIGSFQLKNPAIAVRLETAQEMIDFAQTEADVAIRAGKGDWPGLRCHHLMKVDFSPMLSPELAASIGGLSTPADLLKLRLIDPGDSWWKVWLTAAGVGGADLESRPRSRLGAQSFEAQAAVAGQGVAMLTPVFYAEELAMGRLIQPFDLICDEGSHYWLAYPESRRNAPKIRAFRDWLLNELKPGEPA